MQTMEEEKVKMTTKT